jgi:hypothetical protein
VSLLEIIRALAGEYVQIAVNLDTAMGALAQGKLDIWQDDEHRGGLTSVLETLGSLCITYEMPVTRRFVDKIIVCFREENKTLSNELLHQYLHQLRETFIAELSTKLFFQMTSGKVLFFESPWKGWEGVKDKFPDAATDIEEMSKCFALSRYAACVFHSLLVVERGLIALGRELRVTDPKLGWDATCGKMQQIIVAGHAKYPTLSIGFPILEQINQSAQAMKHAWRNKVNHAAGQLTVMQADFAPDVAEEIMVATRAFMRRLATDLPI